MIRDAFKADVEGDAALVEYVDWIAQATLNGVFHPAVCDAIKIGLTVPATTCIFSTLRCDKTWNRSTMGDARLSGLCTLSLHRKRVLEGRTLNSLTRWWTHLYSNLDALSFYSNSKLIKKIFLNLFLCTVFSFMTGGASDPPLAPPCRRQWLDTGI